MARLSRLFPWLVTFIVVLSSWPWIASQTTSPTTVLAQTSGATPTTYYVTERFNRAIARVDVDGAGHATVTNDYVTDLPNAGPDSVVFDHEGHLIVSNTDAGTISAIDPAQRLITRPTINTTPFPGVADLALDPASDIVWAIQFSKAHRQIR